MTRGRSASSPPMVVSLVATPAWSRLCNRLQTSTMRARSRGAAGAGGSAGAGRPLAAAEHVRGFLREALEGLHLVRARPARFAEVGSEGAQHRASLREDGHAPGADE